MFSASYSHEDDILVDRAVYGRIVWITFKLKSS